MTKDLNKGICNVKYNVLNLPECITFTDGGRIKYVYSASGEKLEEQYLSSMSGKVQPKNGVNDWNNSSTLNMYFGNIVYRNGESSVFNDYATLDSRTNNPIYHNFLKDHLGNVRIVVNDRDSIEQENHYYAFGGLMGISKGGNAQPYKYNGKELDRTNGLALYDYGARMYDAALGMWHSMDPLAEKYHDISPYAYCGDNPIKAFDPDRKREWPVNKTYKGKIRYFSPNYHQSRPGHLHQGVDINIGSRKDDLGALVLATHSGIVTLKKSYHDKNGAGNRVKITSKDGKVATLYMHLNSFAKGLKVGSVVKESQQIGTIGGSGFGSLSGQNVHLHYEMFVDGKHVNPAENNKHLKDPQKMCTDKAPVIDVPQK